ncbi:MAG: phage major capsid protein [Bacteroidales bacterium]|nr:phage major capsid protein [Bacteroidales bacterium]
MDENVEKVNQTFEEMKKLLDLQDKEIQKYGSESAELKSQIEELNKRIDEYELKMKRPAFETTSDDNTKLKQEFFKAVTRREPITSEEFKTFYPDIELKALNTLVDTQGGYLVPTVILNEIIKKVTDLSPIRSLARVRPITVGNDLEVPKQKNGLTARWTSETTIPTETNATTDFFGFEKIPTHMADTKPLVTSAMQEDAAFNLEQWINEEIAIAFAKLEGLAFLSGTGVNQPEGLLTRVGVTQVKSGSNSGLTADGLITATYTLKSPYVRNARWIMKRATIGEIRKLKDSVTGTYMWQPGLVAGQPSSLLEIPIVECEDMPSVAAGAYPIILGDIYQAYWIVDKRAMTILKDVYSSKPFVEYYTTKRVGGQVVNEEAFIKVVVGA